MTYPCPPLPRADFECWISESWQTEQRYYQADIMQDLFGTWLLKRSWGSLHSRLGNSKTLAAKDYAHALTVLEEIAKQRHKRGYIPVTIHKRAG